MTAPSMFPNGHFYSPYADLADLKAVEESLWHAPSPDVPGLDLCRDEQLALVESFAALGDTSLPDDPATGWRYYADNDWFRLGDATLLHCILRVRRPRFVLEVGSGYSSAVILDTVERHLEGHTTVSFVEPNPGDRLLQMLRPEDHDRYPLVPAPLQEVPLEIFEQFEPGDILFIDSTHVAKVGSDVTHLFFEILPRLAPGVLVHVHDIHHPFEYPRAWIEEGRAWNETYVLRAFLQYNEQFRTRAFLHWLWLYEREALVAAAPGLRVPGSSFWFERVAA